MQTVEAEDSRNICDPCSFSRPDLLTVTHLHLEWDVNFKELSLIGNVSLKVRRKVKDIGELILDTRNLSIFDITDINTGDNLEYTTLAEKGSAAFGNKLTIILPDQNSETYDIKINYATSRTSSALQWLVPEQTVGKMHPYLFSQCEAIHARSMLPCQDTPSVKTTYTSKVMTSPDLTVLMSAVQNNVPMEENGKKTYLFAQKVPVPSYLIAIVVGALEKRKISDRIDVWSEKSVVDKAAYEFSAAETMLKTAEDIIGPYIWGRYDILVLPSSFPFGGMENPCLTFVTPTLLAGDRSQANVIAHEISHSWTGNLVTNKSFEHFWLNEGFTVFLERKIIGRMYGEKHRQFASIGGWKDLKDIVNTLGDQHPFTQLVVNLNGIDPDDAFSSVPYEKGYAFLYYLEQLLGGPEIFEPFLREYVKTFKFQSIDTETWKNHLFGYFKKEKSDVLSKIDWNTWLFQPGMPPEMPIYDSTLEQLCQDLCKRWTSATPGDLSIFTSNDLDGMSSLQIQEFLTLLLEHERISIEKIEKMQELYKFNSITNWEIRFRWIRLCLQSHWKEIISPAIQFVTAQGRMKYIGPIYRALYAWEESRPIAIQTFMKYRNEMMYMSANCAAKELHLEGQDVMK